jgi:hypothetical protein
MPKFLTLFAAIIMFAAAAYGQPATCKVFDKHGNPKCCGATSFADCPVNGCGADLKLSAAKNRTDVPGDGMAQHKTIIEIAGFKHPASWKPNTGRAKLVKWGEGTPLEVTLYLKSVKNYADGAVACNCNIDGD